MNKLGLILLSLFFFTAEGNAQMVDSNPSDSLVEEASKKPHQDLMFIDLNWDYLINLPAGVQQQWYGRGISAGLVYDHPFTKDGTFSGAIGASITSHNYYLNALVNRYDSGEVNYSEFQVVGDTILDRGKISINYVDVPFELRFRTKENDKGLRWKLMVGGKVGYLINVHEKIIDNQGIKIKTFNYPNINQIRYGVSARVGYGAIMVSAFYSLSPVFQSSNSLSDQHAFSLGVTLVPF